MNITVHTDFEQRSAQWNEVRRGVPTASSAHRIVTPKRKKVSAQHVAYARELAIELFMDREIGTFKGTEATAHGIATEQEAREWFLGQVGIKGIDPSHVPAFVFNEDLGAGCSPDLLLPQLGAEIKCQQPRKHFTDVVKHHFDQGLVSDHNAQIQFSMTVCDRDQWFLVLYNRKLPIYVRIERDPEFDVALRMGIEMVIAERDRTLKSLSELWQDVHGDPF